MKVWIDVGAHIGQSSFEQARADPNLQVYAFEPLLQQALQTWNKLPNYHMLPMAVSEHNGFAEFHINAYEQASSLLPMTAEGVRDWIGGEAFKSAGIVLVPCTRLDTFLTGMHIQHVDFLKVDAQGYDLNVIKSLGVKIAAVDRIQLEVALTNPPLYHSACSRKEVVQYMHDHGFKLISSHPQSHGQEENLIYER